MVDSEKYVLDEAGRTEKSGLLPDTLLPECDRDRVLHEWNRTTRDFPLERCLHQLIEDRATRAPDNLAVTGYGRSLTYRQLHEAADALAAELQLQGVGPDVPVGLFVERSLEMAIGMLAIMKAGGAYVPLDPRYPQERLEFILADTAMPLVLTQKQLLDRARKFSVKTVCVDADRPLKQPSLSDVRSDSLACIFYTSGSTGTPKGVMLTHRNLVNYCSAALEAYDITDADRVLQFFSMNFDGSVEELFPAWICGATVVLRPDELASSIDAFQSFLAEHAITLVSLPTAFWHEWVRAMERDTPELPSSLRMVLVGGEKASKSLYKVWCDKTNGRVRWLNTYGPTECTVVSTIFEPSAEPADELPIGRAIANTQLYVLNEQLQPVAIGVSGELLIGGEGVARGYLNRAEMTAEKFVPNPFGPGRLYRTGDRVRWQPDGMLAFEGRADNQVKIRGFRVEPDEIVAVLESHEAVTQAVVIAREDMGSQKMLAVYFLANEEVVPEILREFALEQLPEYMVPSAFVQLEAFPCAPGGKLDRQSLPKPKPEQTLGVRSENFVSPQGPEERSLAALWCELLHLESVGAHDDFFELGGHSLLAIQLIDRLGEMGCQLLVADLFQDSTLRRMASAIKSNAAVESEDKRWSSLVTLRKGAEGRAPLFILHTAPGDLLMYASMLRHLPADLPCYGFQSLGLQDAEHVHDSIESMARHYVELLREFYPSGPYMLCGWCYGGVVAQEMAIQLQEQGCAVSMVATFDGWANPPRDLKRRVYYFYNKLRLFQSQPWSKRRAYLWERISNRLGLIYRKKAIQQELKVEVKHGLLKNRDEVYHLNGIAFDNHHPRYYAGEMKIFRPSFLADDLLPDLLMGWDLLSDKQELILIPGDHRSLMHEPHVRELAEELTRCIGAAEERSG